MRICSWRPGALLIFLTTLVAFPPYLVSQSFTGTVNGTVTDTTGGVLPNVKVTLTNERTNETKNTNTDASGVYTFSLVSG
jgi:hypothetical protein